MSTVFYYMNSWKGVLLHEFYGNGEKIAGVEQES
jgi:hypothetical protein